MGVTRPARERETEFGSHRLQDADTVIASLKELTIDPSEQQQTWDLPAKHLHLWGLTIA